jgi:hypothetical protein
MRRFVRVASIALILAGSTGCHHWPTRHVAAASYSGCCDPCVGATSVVRPINSIAGPPVVSKVLPSGMAAPQYP